MKAGVALSTSSVNDWPATSSKLARRETVTLFEPRTASLESMRRSTCCTPPRPDTSPMGSVPVTVSSGRMAPKLMRLPAGKKRLPALAPWGVTEAVREERVWLLSLRRVTSRWPDSPLSRVPSRSQLVTSSLKVALTKVRLGAMTKLSTSPLWVAE